MTRRFSQGKKKKKTKTKRFTIFSKKSKKTGRYAICLCITQHATHNMHHPTPTCRRLYF
jgi:hypothetical protein